MDVFIEVNAAFPWFFPTVVFIFGAAIGSFLNVCIYRIPAERSIVTPGSTCACGKPIAWYNNIPILSWLILRGRARCCGQRFSIRYPAIELLTGLLFLAAWLHHPPARAAAGMVMISMLICATFIDFDHMIIPDRFSVGLALVGLAASALVPSLHGIQGDTWFVDALRAVGEAGIGLLVSSGVVLWIGLFGEVILRKEAMGFGDVKLMGGIGAFLGWQGGVFAIFAGAVIGTIAFAAILLWHGLFGKRRAADAGKTVEASSPQTANKPASAPKDADPEMESEDDSPMAFGRETPFGPMLAGGALVYFLLLQQPVDDYFNLVAEIIRQFS